MTTKRTPLRRDMRRRITPEVIEAFQKGDFHRLHFALGLKPWHPSPLHLGDEPPRDDSPWEQSRPMIQEIRRNILEAIRGNQARSH